MIAMIRMGSWKLRYWILAGYAIPLVAIALSTILTAISLNAVHQRTHSLELFHRIEYHIAQIYTDVKDISILTRGYLLSQESQLLDRIINLREVYTNDLDILEELMAQQGREAEVQAIRQSIQSLRIANNQLLEAARGGNLEEAIVAWRSGVARGEAEHLSEEVHRLFERNNDLTERATQEQAKAIQGLSFSIWAIAFSAISLSVLAAWRTFQRTTRQMDTSAQAIVHSSAAIAETVTIQEQNTQQQASSIRETDVTMGNLRSSSQQSAQQAASAQTEAEQARQLAERGRQVVIHTLTQMMELQKQVAAVTEDINGLQEKTTQIQTISDLVGELAEQTNMLALNAAVEAVRAGDRGRGFTVVSEAIRQLADRSKTSALEISALIADIQKTTGNTAQSATASARSAHSGVESMQETAEVFQGVTLAVETIATNSQTIAIHLQEQAAAIEQISLAMTDLKQTAQQTVEGIQQVKVGTQELNSAAIDLQAFV